MSLELLTSENSNKDFVLPPENDPVRRFAEQIATLEKKIFSQNQEFDPELIKNTLAISPSEETLATLKSKSGEKYYDDFSNLYLPHLEGARNGWLHALSQKCIRSLTNSANQKQSLESIKKTLCTMADISGEYQGLLEMTSGLLKNFEKWPLRKLSGAETGPRTAIDIAAEFLGNYKKELQFENRLDQWELGLIFKKDSEYASNKLLEIIKNRSIYQDNISLAVILATDLIGAGEALKKINNLIVENRKGGNREIVGNLERAQAYLVPVENKEVFAELESFYRKFNIKEHEINNIVNEREVALLKELVPSGSKVLESGCGTGRLLLALKEAGYDIAGYDLLPENVDEVIKVDPKADVSIDNWHHTKYPDENFNAVYSLGRNILHEYSLPGQVQLFREAARVLKKGGKFIFDIPDREKGMYAENIRAYKEAMNRKKNYNLREGTVYDSPNGEHFSTRYCFSDEDIRNLARLTGFKVTTVRREDLPTGKGDENLYYVLEKI